MIDPSLNRPTIAQRLLRLAGRLPLPKKQWIFGKMPPYKDDTAREFVISFHGLEYCGTLSEYVDRHIFYFGSYSPSELSFLRHASAIIRQHRSYITFVDVGANVGQHSLFMSRHADRIISFEPNDAVADRFVANIRNNRIENIELFRCALGSDTGSGRLGSGLDRNSGSRSLVWTLDGSNDTVVSIASGDSMLHDVNVERVDILKIDVEGYEKNVLIGMRKHLERDRPVILFELVGKGLKGGFTCEDELREALYSNAVLFSLGGASNSHLIPFDWRNEEAVCIPVELQDSFSPLIV